MKSKANISILKLLFMSIICTVLPSFASPQNFICMNLFELEIFNKDPIKFYTKKMPRSHYYDDLTESDTRFYDKAERKKFMVTFERGLLLNFRGDRIDTGIYNYTFVMDAAGNFYIYLPENITGISGRNHHSSFLAGGPVAAAGGMKIQNGILKVIDNQSGHYTPELPFLLQSIQMLEERGVDLKNVAINGFEKEIKQLKRDELPNFTKEDLERLQNHNRKIDLDLNNELIKY